MDARTVIQFTTLSEHGKDCQRTDDNYPFFFIENILLLIRRTISYNSRLIL